MTNSTMYPTFTKLLFISDGKPGDEEWISDSDWRTMAFCTFATDIPDLGDKTPMFGAMKVKSELFDMKKRLKEACGFSVKQFKNYSTRQRSIMIKKLPEYILNHNHPFTTVCIGNNANCKSIGKLHLSWNQIDQHFVKIGNRYTFIPNGFSLNVQQMNFLGWYYACFLTHIRSMNDLYRHRGQVLPGILWLSDKVTYEYRKINHILSIILDIYMGNQVQLIMDDCNSDVIPDNICGIMHNDYPIGQGKNGFYSTALAGNFFKSIKFFNVEKDRFMLL